MRSKPPITKLSSVQARQAFILLDGQRMEKGGSLQAPSPQPEESFYSKGSKGRDGVESDITSFLGKGREFQEIGSTPSFCSYRVMTPAREKVLA